MNTHILRPMLISSLLALCTTGCGSEESRDLLVSSALTGAVIRFDGATGAYKQTLAQGPPVQSPNGILITSGKQLVFSDFLTHEVYQFSLQGVLQKTLGKTVGTPYGVLELPNGDILVSDNDAPDTVGTKRGKLVRIRKTDGVFTDFTVDNRLNGPDGITLGPDGNVYVASQRTKQILRVNGTTGAFMNVFAEGSGLAEIGEGPSGVTFSPDGNTLYVGDHGDHFNHHVGGKILRYDAKTGAFIDIFVPYDRGGLRGPLGILFLTGGDMIIASFDSNSIQRYDAKTGADKLTPTSRAPST